MPFEKKKDYEVDDVWFDLKDNVETNFNKYQNGIRKFPHLQYQIKLRFDQFLKALSFYNKENAGKQDETIVAFDVVGKDKKSN